MPEQSDRAWLVEPVGANEVRIHIDVGDGAEISDEARAALDTLVDELQASEVEGFGTFPPCPSLKGCSGYECGVLGKCAPLTKYPCFMEMQCRIQIA